MPGAAPRLTSGAVAIDPARPCAEITRALPAGGILVADAGHSGIGSGTLVELEPRQTYSARGGVARLGLPGLARRKMRGARPYDRLLIG